MKKTKTTKKWTPLQITSLIFIAITVIFYNSIIRVYIGAPIRLSILAIFSIILIVDSVYIYKKKK